MSESPPDKPESPAPQEPPAEPRELTQEELARRVDALAKDEDELERVARVEEQKLLERREQQKGPGKKNALEIAASKRLAKIGEKAAAGAPAARAVAQLAERDALIDRTAQFGKWFEKNSKGVGYAVLAALVVAAGLLGANALRERKEAKASAELTHAVDAQDGRIGDPDKEPEEGQFKDPSPVFKTEADRRAAALAQYRDVQKKYAGTGAAMLARLGEGALLLDDRKADEAIVAFREAKDSPLGRADVDVRARALEGLGFAFELQSKWDDALAAYKEMEATGALGFKELGVYHQARVLEQKGDKEKAKELLKKVLEGMKTPGQPLKHLERVAEDRLRTLDPDALPARPQAPPDMRRILEQMGAGGPGGMQLPPMPPRGGGR